MSRGRTVRQGSRPHRQGALRAQSQASALDQQLKDEHAATAESANETQSKKRKHCDSPRAEGAATAAAAEGTATLAAAEGAATAEEQIADGLSLSVQDRIFNGLRPLGGARELKFQSAGREDADVRMLGGGRPFLIELIDPTKALRIRKTDWNAVASEITRNAHDNVAVRAMMLCDKSATEYLKQGENDKRKSYLALISLSRPWVASDVDIINRVCDLEITQRTPMRTINRRALIDRKKLIHRLSVAPIWGTKFATLQLEAQAGTYIKEFCHSDLGRTRPSLSTLLDVESAEIHQLDVLNVHMAWLDEEEAKYRLKP